jgi:hypothetical protein
MSAWCGRLLAPVRDAAGDVHAHAIRRQARVYLDRPWYSSGIKRAARLVLGTTVDHVAVRRRRGLMRR